MAKETELVTKRKKLQKEQEILSNKLSVVEKQLTAELLKERILFLESLEGRYFQKIDETSYKKYRYIRKFYKENFTVDGITLTNSESDTDIMSYFRGRGEHMTDIKTDYVEITKKEFDKVYNKYLTKLESVRQIIREVAVEKK